MGASARKEETDKSVSRFRRFRLVGFVRLFASRWNLMKSINYPLKYRDQMNFAPKVIEFSATELFDGERSGHGEASAP
jgi:hypothetical protein